MTTFSSGTVVMLGTKLVAFGVPGAIIGGVMIALGLLFTASSRTGLEQWIYEGFWGVVKGTG
ncbi:hypothetical protein [Nitrincola sp. A-D6]|uniref:hypothetical protein n=1 Tax=Nitrincola sp. A-D6 TaxID=1545442 RepID=UPI00136433E4|nr:hypothetical protein [Nitrincola sp. A-D6]